MTPTPQGIAHCKRRLSSATALDDLETVWGNLGVAYQKDADVYAHYLRCKKGLN